jgi:hypothetical protein
MRLAPVLYVLWLLPNTFRPIVVQQPLTTTLTATQYHLTAHLWSPLNITKGRYLDAIEGACRFIAKHPKGKAYTGY